jgi:hypothetical protein
MFGTELDTAYFDTSLQNQPSVRFQEQPASPPQPPPTTPPSITAENRNEYVEEPTMALLQNNSFLQNDQIIKDLQKELQQQKSLNNTSPKEPLYERYISKKKDVLKLISISLTVLLGISMHFVFSDLIKSYLEFNDFTYNKESMIKAAYPLCVFFVMWSLKVFNK